MIQNNIKMSQKITTYFDIFKSVQEKYADNIAVFVKVSDETTSYTYKELFEVSCKLYNELNNYVKKGECIGLLMNHHPYIPSIISAIHRCGCSFMFMNTNDSFSNNEKIMKDFQVNTLFSSTDILLENFQTHLSILLKDDYPLNLYQFQESEHFYKCCLLCSGLNRKRLTLPGACRYKSKRLTPHSSLSQKLDNTVAYCIKTSGSTAIQKNVVVTHLCIYPNIEDLSKLFDVKQDDIIYFSTPLTFDPSMIELYLAAYSGASLLICEDKLTALMTGDSTPTIWQTTPSLFMKIGSENIKHLLSENSKLKVLALGGEAFNFNKLLDFKNEKNSTSVFNLYGITEVSCWASACKINFSQPLHEISIGPALSKTLIRLKNEIGEEVSEGIGVIEIGSLSRKCLVTSSLKINDFYNENILWQATGDMGEKKSDGSLYFRGRHDRLIKRFGRKVNLLEIENAASSFPGIQQAACIWLPKYHSVCLLVASNEDNIKIKLSQALQSTLDTHSLPDVICVVSEIPLSCHGKVSISKAYDLYESFIKDNNEIASFEKAFFNMLKENISQNTEFDCLAEKSFIDVGGNSIIAMQIVNKIENFMKINIPELFSYFMDSNYTLDTIVNYLKNSLLKDDQNSTKSCKNNLKRKLSEPQEFVKKLKVASQTTDELKTIQVKWKVHLDKCIDAKPVLYKDSSDCAFVLVGSHSGIIAMVETASGNVAHMWKVASRIEAPVLCVNHATKRRCIVGAHNGKLWCFSLVAPYEVVWKVALKAMIKSQACCYKSLIFAATYAGVIWQVNIKDGVIITSCLIDGECISADLIISHNNIFTATLKGTCCRVQVLENEMDVKWKTKLSSPVFARPTFIKNDEQILFNEAKGVIHCLDSNSGNHLWKFSSTQGSVFSSCLPYSTKNDGDFIVFGCHDQHCYHLKLTNQYNDNATQFIRVKHSSEIFATSCIYDTSFVVCVSTNGQLQIINVDDNQVRWKFTLPGQVFSSPVVSGNEIYLGCRDDYLYCLNVV